MKLAVLLAPLVPLLIAAIAVAARERIALANELPAVAAPQRAPRDIPLKPIWRGGPGVLPLSADSLLYVSDGSGERVEARDFAGRVECDEDGLPDRIEFACELRPATAGEQGGRLLGTRGRLALSFSGRRRSSRGTPVASVRQLELEGTVQVGGATRYIRLPMFAVRSRLDRLRLSGNGDVSGAAFAPPGSAGESGDAAARRVSIVWDLAFEKPGAGKETGAR
mgnify:CR=1 FL=1